MITKIAVCREINSKLSIVVDNINFIIIYLKVIFVEGWFPTFLLKNHNFCLLGINGEQPIVTIFCENGKVPFVGLWLRARLTNTKSSAYNKQFNFEPLGNVIESVSSRSSKEGISFKYKLNNMGERIQPCHTPFW